MRPISTFSLALVVTACGASQPPTSWSDNRAKSSDAAGETRPGEPTLDNALAWVREAYSPRPGSHPEPELEALVAHCGQHDVALSEVAGEVARLASLRPNMPTLDEVGFLLRKRGSTYVAPRLWTAELTGGDVGLVEAEFRKFAKAHGRRGAHHCGVGAFRDERGGLTVVALDAEVLAYVAPLETEPALGSRPKLVVNLGEDATDAEVVVLPPSGAPRHVRGTLRGRRFEAELRFFERGPTLVQVLATMVGGPMPVASILLGVDESPPDFFESRDVPGERAFDPTLPADEALLALVNGARRESGLGPVRVHPTLARVARAHTELMRAQGRISHDAGDDTPAARVAAAGLSPRGTGENVALASTVVRLHRALWSSPSHRENLLLPRWNVVGISVLEDEAGQLFATELFADLPP